VSKKLFCFFKVYHY